jgi:hypothetical protein
LIGGVRERDFSGYKYRDINMFFPHPLASVTRDTHTKRQATQQGGLPCLLGDGDKGMEIVYGEEKNILYWAD